MKIGDIVLYHRPGPKKADRSRDVESIRPAVVLAVHEDASVDLAVFLPGALPEPRNSIKRAESDKPKADRFEERA